MTTKKLIQAVVVQWQRSFVPGRGLEFPLLLWRRGPGRGGRLYRIFSVTILVALDKIVPAPLSSPTLERPTPPTPSGSFRNLTKL